jgi:hypothetical protein
MRRWLELTPRGDSFDPLYARWHAIQAVWWGLRQDHNWLRGAGPDTTERLLTRYSAGQRVALPSGAAFNEPLQLWYEYGVAGLLAMATFAWHVLPHLRPGDPWSAAWVIGVVLACTHWPMRLPMVGMVFLAISGKVVST